MIKNKKVLVAMSGGVDSSVAAALLAKQGYSCIGVFMNFWREEELTDHNPLDSSSLPSSGGPDFAGAQSSPMRDSDESRFFGTNRCCSIDAQEQARKVAQKLKIPFYTLNYKEAFKQFVVSDYIKEYQSGKTPNPCVVCNEFIKFGLLLREAEKQGCDFLATGHYARVAREGKPHEAQINTDKDAKPGLYRSVDNKKDQTYFLYRLKSEQLAKILFPVGKYEKSKVREIAKKFNLPTATRKDSRGICFVSTTNEAFLKKYLTVIPGIIVDTEGVEIGKHEGLLYYTIGQRHGYGNLTLKKSKLGENKGSTPPLYVVKIDVKNNILIVGKEEELYSKKATIENVMWISGKEPTKKEIGARIRYLHPIEKCRFKKVGKNYQITFEKPQRAITPGQALVLYDKDLVLGGGVII